MRSEQNTSHVQNVLDLFPLNHGQKIKVYSRYMVRAVSDKWSILSTDALKKTPVEQVFIMDIVYWKVHKVQNFYRLLIIFYNSTGGVKKYEESCLDSDRKFLVVSRKTAFEIEYLFQPTLKIFRHAASFEGLSEEFNDYTCDGKFFIPLFCRLLS